MWVGGGVRVCICTCKFQIISFVKGTPWDEGEG